jgi:hypothetical protein
LEWPDMKTPQSLRGELALPNGQTLSRFTDLFKKVAMNA